MMSSPTNSYGLHLNPLRRSPELPEEGSHEFHFPSLVMGVGVLDAARIDQPRTPFLEGGLRSLSSPTGFLSEDRAGPNSSGFVIAQSRGEVVDISLEQEAGASLLAEPPEASREVASTAPLNSSSAAAHMTSGHQTSVTFSADESASLRNPNQRGIGSLAPTRRRGVGRGQEQAAQVVTAVVVQPEPGGALPEMPVEATRKYESRKSAVRLAPSSASSSSSSSSAAADAARPEESEAGGTAQRGEKRPRQNETNLDTTAAAFLEQRRRKVTKRVVAVQEAAFGLLRSVIPFQVDSSQQQEKERVDILKTLAASYLDGDRYQELIALSERYPLEFLDSDLLVYKGICFYHLDRDTESLFCFQRVIEQDSTHLKGRFWRACLLRDLGRTYLAKGNNERAKESFVAAIRDLDIYQALVRLELGRQEEEPACLEVMAEVYWLAGERALASERLATLDRCFPNNPFARQLRQRMERR